MPWPFRPGVEGSAYLSIVPLYSAFGHRRDEAPSGGPDGASSPRAVVTNTSRLSTYQTFVSWA